MKVLLRLSMKHLKIKRLRSLLTISGIMIGIVSLVTTIAIGKGYKNTVLKELDQHLSATEIYVYSPFKDRKDRLLNDKLKAKLETLEHVTNVYPVLTAYDKLKINGYEYYGGITGIATEYMEDLPIKDGRLPIKNGSRPELFLGGGARNEFYSRKAKTSYAESSYGNDPLIGQKMAYGNYIKLPITGLSDNEYDTNIYADIDAVKIFLKRQIDLGLLEENNVKVDGCWNYDEIILKVDSPSHVKIVTSIIKDMGYEVRNDLEVIEETNEKIRSIRLILITIGTIASIVAIIGIINTMMTAVYDRLGEIALFKVLGADNDQIQLMFLYESSVLGIAGGVFGVILSYLLSFIINKKLIALLMLEKGARIVEMSFVLMIAAVCVSLLVSILAGFIPAHIASKVRPLSAIS